MSRAKVYVPMRRINHNIRLPKYVVDWLKENKSQADRVTRALSIVYGLKPPKDPYIRDISSESISPEEKVKSDTTAKE